MVHQLKTIQSNISTSKWLLTIWFSIALIGSIVFMLTENVAPIAICILNIFYIYTVQEKKMKIKKIGFWIHTIISGFVGLVATVWFIAAYVMISKDNAKTHNASPEVLSQYLTTMVCFIVYFIFTLPAIAVFWSHVKEADSIESLRNGNY